MLHRRLLYDDGRGVGEALNETGINGNGLVIRSRHLLLLQPIDVAAATLRIRAEEHTFGPLCLFGDVPNNDVDSFVKNYHVG